MKIVAEIGTSHGGSLEKAKELIRAARDAGADFVKFQWVYAREILHPDTGAVPLPGGLIRLYDRFRELEVPPDFFVEVSAYARSEGCGFICSPFGLQSLDELFVLEPDAIKIASPELNHYPLLERLSQTNARRINDGKSAIPVIFSSGVSSLADIAKALVILRPMCLLHCVTAYPAPESEYNVRLVKTLRDIFGIPTGISDHSLDPVIIPVLTVACGGVMLEKHITLNRKTAGLDDPVALDPKQFARMTDAVRKAEQALGDGVKKLAPAEKENYGRTNRSLHYMRAMSVGETIAANDVAVLRTEKILESGISPEFLPLVTGSVLTRTVKFGDGVQLLDFFQKM
jgi:sialic acid synthase SpsE